MSFTFNTGIPAAGNNPSNDQPIMQANNVATDGILNVDHISFNANDGGTHKQVHLTAFTNPTVINTGVTTEGSVIYSAAGVADTARAACKFKNDRNIPYVLNLIKAWAYVDGATGNIISSQSMNVTSTTRTSAGNYSIVLDANTVTGTNFSVLVSSSQTPPPPPVNAQFVWNAYTITGAGTFTIKFDNSASGGGKDVVSFGFIVLQI